MSASTAPIFDPRPTREQPDDDPHLWLESIDGAEVLAWVDQQNEKTMARFGGPDFEHDRDVARALLDRPDRIPFVQRHGGWLYNFWRDADHPRGIWRRIDEAGYRTQATAWQVLLDLDALASAEGEDWTWSGYALLKGNERLALLRLSRGGSDAVVLREFDLSAGAFVADGFSLPEAKSHAVWLDRDTLLLTSAHGPDMATRSGYARTVRLWARHADPRDALVLFRAAESSMAMWGSVHRQADTERLIFVEQIAFFDAAIFVGDRSGHYERLDLPTDAGVQMNNAHVAVRLRSPWRLGEVEHAVDSVLVIMVSDLLAGRRTFTPLWAPQRRQALQSVFWAAGRLIVHALDNLTPTYAIFESTEGSWTQRPLPGLPALGSIDVWPLDSDPEDGDGSLLAIAQDPLTPPTLLSYPPALQAPEILRKQPLAFDAGELRVTRHEARSEDGTMVPYVEVGPNHGGGEAPVHMSAYGGFRHSLLPVYQSVLGKLWLERGGTIVTANIRGGGEFGTAWHDAGRRDGKARSHDDFAAVAADLVLRGVTKPARIAAQGGSNGGLLIANMLTRYPERFGALFCTIPLIDMRRYSRLLAGASWIAEYGDPDDPDDWAFIQRFSAYHAAEAGRSYPPILLATTRRDDRVHPGHARKMARKLQVLGYEAHCFEPATGGHGYGRDNAEVAAFMALGIAFLRRSIGWTDNGSSPS